MSLQLVNKSQCMSATCTQFWVGACAPRGMSDGRATSRNHAGVRVPQFELRTPEELSEILIFLLSRDVSLVHSMHLTCDVTGVSLKQVADSAGIGRGHLYQMLRGTRRVSVPAREAFMCLLGIDPWSLETPGGASR